MASRQIESGGNPGSPSGLIVTLAGLLSSIRGSAPLDPITVVTPSIYSAFYLRRAMAGNGLFNVRFTRLEDLAELIAGPGGHTPLSHMVASELIHAVVSEATLRLPELEAVRSHHSLHEALHRTFTEFETAPRTVVDAIGEADPLRREIAALYRAYEARASGFERRPELVGRAVRALQDPGKAAELGTVLLMSSKPPSPAYQDLLSSLARLPGARMLPDPPAEADYASTLCVSVPDPTAEVSWTVRDVVERGAGTPFSRMAVFYVDEAYGRRLNEAFALAGIPASGPDPTPLIERPEGRFLDRATSALAGRDLPLERKQVIDWLVTSPVRPPDGTSEFHASRWDSVSRNAGVTRGLDEWRRRLASYATRQEDHGRRRLDLGEIDEPAANGLRAEAGEARALLRFVEDLAATARPPGSPASWATFSEWLGRLVDRFLDKSSVGPAAVERLGTLIRKLALLDEAGGRPPGLERFISVLRRELTQTTGGGRPMGTGVFVAPIRYAAGTDFDVVYLVGMVEGAFPPPATDDSLIPDELRVRLDPEGHLERRQTRQETQYRRFAAALASGRQRVLLWPRSEPGASRRAWPSRWFVEAARKVSASPKLQAGELLTKDLDGVVIVGQTDRVLAKLDQAACADSHELDLHILLGWRASAGSLSDHFLARLEGGLLGRGVRLERSRRSASWTEFDGDLTAAPGSLASASAPVSPTSLEAWATCPFRYFLGTVLRLRPAARPEEAFEISALDRGAVIHGILEAYFQRTSVSRCDSTASRRLAMQEAIEEGLKRAEAVYVTGRRVMWHLERERITRDLLAFVDQESERCAQRGLAQRHAEFRFGIGQTGPGPVSVELPGLGTVRFRGVIDRVETNDDGSEAVVVDYKTGSASAYSALKDDPIDHGMRLQLPIYAEAVRAAFPSARSVAAQYWFVSERGGYRLIPDPPVSARAEMLDAVATITRGISAGVFVARPGTRLQAGYANCQFCPFDQVCPSARERHWEQKSQDPRLDSYRALAGEEPEASE